MMRTSEGNPTEEGCPFPPAMPGARVVFERDGVAYELLRTLREPDRRQRRMLAWRRLPDGRAEPVVLTQLVSSKEPHHRLRLFEEAMRVRRLSHPVICRFHELARRGGELHAITEYVDGVSLEKVLRLASAYGRRLSAAFACYVTAEVADALQHAHELRGEHGRTSCIPHGDISARTIRLTRFGRVKLAGFELKIHHPLPPWEIPPRGLGWMQGTELWPKIEQWTYRASHTLRRWCRLPAKYKAWSTMGPGDSVLAEAREDLVSLAWVLLGMLAGPHPLEDNAAAGKSPPRPSSLSERAIEQAVPHAPEHLKAILARALGPESGRRYASGAALRDELLTSMRVWEPPYGEREAAAEIFRVMTGVEGLL
jgi:serine/threonine protein kinase